MKIVVETSGERLDTYLTKINEDLSRSKISKLIKNKNILVNGNIVKSGYTIKEGDVIEIDYVEETLDVIRMLKSATQLAKIELKHELSDEEVVDVVAKQIKMRKDSILEFSKASRDDLVKQYESEIEILNKYMPEQLSRDEVVNIIDEVFATVNPTSQKQMGLIMKEVNPKVRGKFDMGEVSKIIKDKLSNL